MKKRIRIIIMIAFVTLCILCLCISVKGVSKKNKEMSVSSTATEAKENQEKGPVVTITSEGYKKVELNPNQIYSNEEKIIMEDYNGERFIEYTISDATISRECAMSADIDWKKQYERWEKGTREWDSLYSDMSGTLKEGTAFYMNVTVTMTNKSSEKQPLVPSSLNMMAIDFKNNIYEGRECIWNYGNGRVSDYWKKWEMNNYATFAEQTAGKPWDEDPMAVVAYYSKDESVTYNMIFIVPEEYIEDNNIYLFDPFGLNDGRFMQFSTQKYVKVNIANRSDYFE